MKLPPLPLSTVRATSFLCAAFLALPSTPRASGQAPGSQDPAFVTGNDANSRVYALAVQGDDEVIVGGNFTALDGASRNCVARLHTDGSIDAFNPGLAIGAYTQSLSVQAVALQPDGKVVAAGIFTVLNQRPGGGVVRLNSDGSLDSSFNVGTGIVDDGGSVGSAYALAILPNGQILVGGDFQSFDGVATAGLVRLNADGSVDTSFNPGGVGISGNDYGSGVRSIFVEGNGRIVIGGYFSAYDGNATGSVARLNADGTFDATFKVGTGVSDGGVFAVSVQANGQIVVGGGYNTFDGVATQHLVRLNPDGSLDTGYSPTGNLFISEVDALLVQPDGTVLAGGAFASAGGLVNSPHNGLARLLSDGTEDGSFDSGKNSRQVMALALESDGKAFAASCTDALTGSPMGNVFRYLDLVLPTFFAGQTALADGVFYLAFPDGDYFGYYSYLGDPHYLYHFDLGYEYIFDAYDGRSGVYFYDFASDDFFYTSPTFPFPYLYDFGLKTVLYYYPDPHNPGHYNTNGVRYFFNYASGRIITK